MRMDKTVQMTPVGVKTGEYSPNADRICVWSSWMNVTLTIFADNECHSPIESLPHTPINPLDPDGRGSMWYVYRMGVDQP